MKQLFHETVAFNPTVNGTTRVFVSPLLGAGSSIEEKLNELTSDEERARLQRITGRVHMIVQQDSNGFTPIVKVVLFLRKEDITLEESSSSFSGLDDIIDAPFVVLGEVRPYSVFYENGITEKQMYLYGTFNYKPSKIDGLFQSDEHLVSDVEYRTYLGLYFHNGSPAVGTDYISWSVDYKLEVNIERLSPSAFYLAEAGN